jgi:glucokinase
VIFFECELLVSVFWLLLHSRTSALPAAETHGIMVPIYFRIGSKEDGFMHTIIGVDIGGTDTKIGIVQLDGQLLGMTSLVTQSQEGPAICLERVNTEIRRLVKDVGIRGGRPAGVGIGMPGCLDTVQGLVISSPNFPESWFHYPLRDAIASGVELPAVLDNDARAATLGEGWLGAAHGCDNYLVLTLGTGIGGGAVVDGQILRGAQGLAGEFGHMSVYPNGRQCKCGKKGCLEAYASATAVLSNFYERIQELSSAEISAYAKVSGARQVFDLARKGDAIALAVVEQAAQALGIAIGSLATIFNPERVVLAGGMSLDFPMMEDTLRAYARQHGLAAPMQNVLICATPLQKMAGAVGAAALYAYSKGWLK